MNFQELMQQMVELDKPVIEEPNEGNAFSGALDAARDAGKDEFDVDGKTYKVKEDVEEDIPAEVEAAIEQFMETNPKDGDDLQAFHHKAISDRNKDLDDYLTFLYDYVADQTGAGGTEELGVYDEMLDMLYQMIADKGWRDDRDIDEACGLPPPGMSDMPNGMMGMRSGTPPQPDSINANVSLNASGKGGIRDLMDILRNIEGEKEEMPGFGDADADVIVKKMSAPMGLDDDFDNAPDEIYQGVDAVTRTGGDLHSKGIEKPAVAGGGNPMAVESLKERLHAHYNRIKEG